MKPTDIFTDLAAFRSYTEGLANDTTYQQLAPSIRIVATDIKAVITPAVFEDIASFTPSTAPDADNSTEEALEILRTALANGAMAKYAIFAAVKKNGSDASIYKYQHEELKDHYVEAYARAMDELLDWLDAHDTIGGTDSQDDAHSTKWKDSEEYKTRQALPVRNAAEFDRYYGIGRSSFFFSKVLFLVRNIWEYKVKAMLGSSEDEKAVELAKHILVYRVMAAAVMQFDVTELPRSIRWDYNHEYTKGTDMQDRDKLASQLLGQAEAWEKSLQIRLHSADKPMADDLNREENKFFASI